MTEPSPPLSENASRADAPAALRADVREMLHELAGYRELLFSLVRRDLLLRYKQTIMGFGWSVLMPVTYMIVFSLIFTRVVKLQTGVPYPIYVYAGLLPWNFFASSLRFAVGSLTGNATLVTKVYFPRELLPFAAVLVSLVDFLVGGVVLAGLMAWYRVPVGWALAALPVVVLVQVLFTGGVALLLAMGNLYFRDVKYLIEIVITLWMLASSVVYPVERVGGRLAAVLALNPMTPILDAYRAILLHHRLPAAAPFGWAAGVAVVLLAASWLAFHRAEFQFAERI
ncbi:MAG TPA: ABC transporter permease [Candidatus Eisenbacteria bacterium]|nr:ABC transporter permease [Candidatus Eisenbacteria bacterium]